ncbi:MAG: EAL domain-containing protein [Azoarcus sp.]|jgi:diguanylate cyclase (GGDEF)-like protein/PAS domain S-box-containing protein|nr:EAL domain-containing protein [Azoarcus sp.]
MSTDTPLNEPTGDNAPPSVAADSPPLRGIRNALFGIAIIAATLVWLFSNANTISTVSHQEYARELGAIYQTDIRIFADVLAIRFELNKNYDDISRNINAINVITGKLRHPPAFLLEEDVNRLQEKIEELGHLTARKNNLIEIFMRESAILRNSTRYFPTTVRNFIQSPGNSPLRTEINALSNEVTTYMVSDDEYLVFTIHRHIETLRKENSKLPPQTTKALENLFVHAGIMVEYKQKADTKLREITTIPMDATIEQIIQLYDTGYTRAASRANTYRVLLFATALLLTFYLILVFARLGRATQELRNANNSLKQRIDELHRAQDNLKLYATVFNSATEGMVITDGDARILIANPAFTDITGYGFDEIRARSLSLLNSGRHAQNFYQDMWKTLSRRGKWQGEIWNRRRNGEVYPEWLSITAVQDADNNVTHYVGVFSDITERKKNEAHIHHLSFHDPLTNLPNRLFMQERLNDALNQAERIGSHMAVLFLNLDRFRNINDTLGSELGDALLQQVAHRSQSILHDTDTVSRLGSDEFVFILPNTGQPQDVASIARKLLTTIGRPYLLGEHDIIITASIGVAISGTDGTTAAELLRNADAAMSRAKEDGRNNFRFYSVDMNTSTLGDLLLENQLRNAIKHNELELFYQPKIDAGTGLLQSAEALLRWRHPEQGLIPPARFIRLAEESGLIVPIGTWVLRTACRQIRSWREAGLPVVPVAVNLSAQQFLQNDLPVLIHESLETANLEPEMLELELTESMLMRNAERTVDMLARFREMGVGLAIDDFGTGYSSLSYLKQFKVNVLKIDKSFVSDIHNDGADGNIAIAVIGLAHALDLKVVAEGVETDEQRQFLLNHGCDIFQGYLFSRPIPAADFAQKLASLKNVAPEE